MCYCWNEYVAEMPSFRIIMEDHVVTDEEVTQQAGRVIDCLEKLDASLPPETRSLVTDGLCELAVLYALDRHCNTHA